MWWKKKQKGQLKQTMSCCLFENGYSIAIVQNNKRVLLSQVHHFSVSELENIASILAQEVERLNLIAKDCDLVLIPGQYQLLLMDALDIPEAEMAKALRWNLKGLSDYNLDDVAIDACLVPADENSPKKTFVAITPLSELNKKLAIFETAFLNVTSVTIAEMALKNLMPLIRLRLPEIKAAPIIIVSQYDHTRKLHIVYREAFYLIRELIPLPTGNNEEPPEIANLKFEIERSVDFCINQLNLLEPTHLFFTPEFFQHADSIASLGMELSLKAELIDLNQYLEIEPPLAMEKQHEVFYPITGALKYAEEVLTDDADHETAD